MLFILALLVSLAHQIVLISALQTVHHTITLQVAVIPSPDNVWYCTQFKSLSEAWTPRHCGPLTPTQKQISDEWPNMLPSGYEITAELFRDHYVGTKQTVTEFDSVAVRMTVK